MVIEPTVFFDGDGQNRDSIRDPQTGKYHKELNAALVHDIPLDHRQSLYVQYGDWFAGCCGFGALAFLIGGLLTARRKNPAEWTPPAVE